MSPGTGTGTGSATAAAPTVGAWTWTWTWRLTLDEHCVAVAVRTLRRQRGCRHSLQLILSAVTEAQIASGVTCTRRLRGLRLPGTGDAPGLAVRGEACRDHRDHDRPEHLPRLLHLHRRHGRGAALRARPSPAR